ncbi:hypothetical protein GCM10027321_22800 [Massilia terrae]|uniref:Transcriptional regulator n=1 Tax=Massilia terrae TaxID=1811224 RepID=A0ABT2CX72_9BURK|nr:PhaM family polyhydroxyalkanoate granule multifunctional regulatory protein [Massilia terrae]MCS0658587.1 hypothetical protein [Massilia terrae]
MLKPPVPPIPGMTDTLEFVKNLWSGMNVPGVGMPGMADATLSTDALDKKIADLKAIEAWLNMNTSMLRATIQGLEVQRGTLGALKSMSATMAQAMSQASEQAAAAAALNPFMAGATTPGTGASTGKGQDGTQAKGKAGSAKSNGEGGAKSADQAGAQAGSQGAQGGPAGEAVPPGMPGLPAAMAWWNLLQDQFTQAVTGAMAANSAATAAKPGPGPAEPPKDGAAKT